MEQGKEQAGRSHLTTGPPHPPGLKASDFPYRRLDQTGR